MLDCSILVYFETWFEMKKKEVKNDDLPLELSFPTRVVVILCELKSSALLWIERSLLSRAWACEQVYNFLCFKIGTKLQQVGKQIERRQN